MMKLQSFHPIVGRVAKGLVRRVKYRFRPSTRNLFRNMCHRRTISKFSENRLNEVQNALYSFVISHPVYGRVPPRPPRIDTVSVVIPHYNQQAVIGKTIESILEQSLEPLEIIIVDDMSTDRALLRTVTAPFMRMGKVKVLYPDEKLFPGGARELGSKAAAGDIIQFFDSDDLMHPQRLEIVRDIFAAHQDASFIVAGFSAFTGEAPEMKRYGRSEVEAAIISPSRLIDDMARIYSKSRLSYVDRKTNDVPWYAWGGFGAKGARHGCCAGNPAILSPVKDLIHWNSPKAYVFSPYEDFEYCMLLLAMTGGAYHLDLPLTLYRRGYTTSMPLKEL